MNKNVVILRGYTRHSDIELCLDAVRVIAFLTGNADYPSLPVSIDDLQELLNDFVKAFSLASDGGTQLTSIKNDKRILVVAALVKNARYVQKACGNVRSKALGSGYYLGDTNTTKIGPLKKIKSITFSDGLNPAQTKVKVTKPKNALGIVWKYTQDTGPDRVWIQVSGSSGKKTLKKLISGKPLTAKAAGQGANEELVWSDEFTYPMVR